MAYWLNHLTWPDIGERIKEVPVALVPVGATEQHGYHLPVGTDVFLAEKLAEKVSDRTGALIYPSINFGYSWVWNRIITAADPAGSNKRCGTFGGTLWDQDDHFSQRP